MRETVATELRSPQVIAVATILFGLVLWWSDAFGRRTRALDSMRLRHAVLIGCAQALALIPGTSRSGVTMTAALALGLTRGAAARFSFLLSIPVIGLASVLECLQLTNGVVSYLWTDFGLTVLCAGISTYVCIYAFLRLIESVGMLPFVIYRVVLGLFLLWYFA
jgi:undecaprenyl-diphosphatase